MLPICALCTRNARTVDTPRVIVRVASFVVLHDLEGYRAVYRCHGACGVMSLRSNETEAAIEAMSVFAPDLA